MTLTLSEGSDSQTLLDLIHTLNERVADWGDLHGLAATATELLAERLAHAEASIFAYDHAAGELRLLALSGERHGGGVVGTRQRLGNDLLGAAVRQGSTQRRINAYVDPDFVRSLPGQTRSDLAVPLRTGDRVHGVIYLEYESPHRPTQSHEATAELLAAHLAVAFASAPATGPAADGEDGQRLGQVLLSLSSQLAQSDDVAGAMQRVVDGARELIPCDGAALFLRHPARQALQTAAAAGSVPLPLGESIPMDGTALGAALRGGRVLVWKPGSAEVERLCPRDVELGIRDAVIAPLQAGGQTFGVLAVLGRAGEDGPTPEQVDRLQALANQAAAIEPMRQIGPLRQRLSDSSLIAEVGRAVTGTLGLDEVLALIVRAAEMLVGARGVTVSLVTDDRTQLELAAASGALRSLQGQRLPIHGNLMGWVALNGDASITPSVADDPHGSPFEVRLGPGVVVPLESRAKVRGILLAARAEGAPPVSDEDLDALRKLAAYAAIAIDNAHLYREQTELSQALRRQTAELEKAYAEVRESQERLVVSEKMAALGRVTAGIAHEINSPLGGILNCLQLAQQYAGEYQASIRDPDVTPEDHEGIASDLMETLELAQSSTRKVAQFVRTIKGQTRTGEESTRTAFDPAAEVESTLALLQHELRNRHVTLRVELEPGMQLVGDPGKFALVVQNLVSNAIDAYAGEGGEVRLGLSRTDAGLLLEVEDQGCGIPEDIRPRIFDYLFTTKDIGQGTGLGLSIVHSIVTTHFNGEVDLRSQVGAGTTFSVVFPTSTEAG